MARTLFQILTGYKETPLELESKNFNPLKARINRGSLRLKNTEYEENSFRINEIRSIERKVGNKIHPVADYKIVDMPYDGDPIEFRLRVVPSGLKDQPYNAILLTQIASCVYDKDFVDSLSYEKSKGIIQEGNVAYARVNDVKEPWKAEVTLFTDANNDGKVAADEVSKEKITYWDFWRQTESGETEFYFVEMDGLTGYLTFWVGKLVDLNSILVV
jgi:hypothetical protein